MSPKVQLNASGMSRIGLKPATSPRPRTRAPATCICPSLFHVAHSACGPVVIVGWSMKPPRSSSSSRPAACAPRTCSGRRVGALEVRRVDPPRRDHVSPPSTLSNTVTTVGKGSSAYPSHARKRLPDASQEIDESQHASPKRWPVPRVERDHVSPPSWLTPSEIPYPRCTFDEMTTSSGSSGLAATAASDWLVVRRDTLTTVDAACAVGAVASTSRSAGTAARRRRDMAARLTGAPVELRNGLLRVVVPESGRVPTDRRDARDGDQTA